MSELTLLPIAADPARVAKRFGQLQSRASTIGDDGLRLQTLEKLEQEPIRALLEGTFAGSSHLSAILDATPEIVGMLDNPGGSIRKIIDDINKLPIEHRPGLLRALRHGKRKISGILGLADLAGLMSLDEIVWSLTALADAATSRLADHLLLAASRRGEIKIVDETRPSFESGLIIIGMGKLGAFELNYSSDIDLIILFDRDVMERRSCQNPMALTSQLARTLTHTLEQKTSDGYIFRADLRLRPNIPGHPLALSTIDAELYYERQGQNWERAAHIKARPIAGDIEAGHHYLDRLSPFIWRKHLDYAAIKDIQSIKRQINAHHGFGTVNVRGHDIKVGRGGIREIEFFCQTQQLILGGRHPDLRMAGTCAALETLERQRWIEPAVSRDLIKAYVELRRLEHRLQMMADRQTHRIPSNDLDFRQFSEFCGHDDAAAFEDGVRGILSRVEARYAALFETAPDLGGGNQLVFTGTHDDPGTIETLSNMGFRDPSHVASTIRAWHHGHIRATRSTRARELLTELTPSILASFANQPDKDRAFALFDELITSLPAGVQLFSLFHANPGLLELVSDLIGAAPRLIKLLSSSTDLFEAMLTPDFFDSLPSAEELAREYRGRLGDARDRQDVFDISRLWAHARQFQAGLQLFLGLADIRRVAQTLTSIAELMIQRMLREAHEWLEEQHGSMPGGRFVVLGMGKLGSRELSIGSDLDLVFVYDADEQARSDGDRPLAASTYYARLGQRLVTALSARTAEGRLYEIDTRLRPSGNAGPVACSLSNFRRYQQITAETWERQALTRARPVAGPDGLAVDVMTAIDGAVTGPHAVDRLKDDIRAMRMRIFKEHGSDVIWNLKHVRGGLVELEFIAQYLQLAFAHDHPALRQTSTAAVLDAARADDLITAEWRTALMTGLDLMQALLGVLRLSMTEDREVREISAGLQEALVRAATQALSGQPIGNFQGLEALLVETQQTARQIFDTLCPEAAPDDLQSDHS